MQLTYQQAEALNSAIRTIALRHRSHAADVLANFGLHPGQETILLQLDADAPLTQKQLAAGAGCEPPTITLMVRKLESAGLVRRAQSNVDARAVLVELTERGREMMPRLKRQWRELAEQSVASYAATSVDELVEVLTDLAGSLRAG